MLAKRLYNNFKNATRFNLIAPIFQKCCNHKQDPLVLYQEQYTFIYFYNSSTGPYCWWLLKKATVCLLILYDCYLALYRETWETNKRSYCTTFAAIWTSMHDIHCLGYMLVECLVVLTLLHEHRLFCCYPSLWSTSIVNDHLVCINFSFIALCGV